jgi:hypothetical protein
MLVIVAGIACAPAVNTVIYIFTSLSDQNTFELEVPSNWDAKRFTFRMEVWRCNCN